MERTWRVTLVLLVLGAANVAQAQEDPTLQDEDMLTDEALEHARTSPDLQVNAPSRRLTLREAPRHPLRGQRMLRTGGSLVGLGLFGIMVGAAQSALYEPCDDCFEPGPSFGVIFAALIMHPLLVVGVAAAGRGARLRARARRLSAGVQLAAGHYGVTLMGRF